MRRNTKLIISYFLIFLFMVQIFAFFFSSASIERFDNDNGERLNLSVSPNVELISESNLATKWFFDNETVGYDRVYNETFNDDLDYWSLYGVSESVIITNQIPSDDAWIGDNSPDQNHGSEYWMDIAYRSFRKAYTLVKWEYSYLDLNYTSNSTLYFYLDDDNGYEHGIHIYHTDDFDEDTVTWNTQPPNGIYQNSYSTTGPSTFNEADIGEPAYYYKLIADESEYVDLEMYSGEWGGGYSPRLRHHFSKIYQGNGILYCQTNTTETLTLRSNNTLDLELQEGDKLEIVFNTSSTNRIDLNLRNDNIQKETYILSSQGNGIFSTRTQTFTIVSNISIDQLEFTGTFDDTKNLIVDSIRILRAYGEITNYYLAPYERRELTLPYPGNYTIEIYENGNLMETKCLTTSATLQTLLYERIDSEIVYLTYYDSNNEYLDFNLFTTYINYTLGNFTYTDERLSSHILYIDKDSLIEFKIYDSFDVLIKDMSSYEETFIDLTLDVYSLKIKNEAQEHVNYILKNDISGIEKAGNIFPNEIIEFNIATGDYTLNYTNHEDNLLKSLMFEFTTHKIITINTTYHQVYFGLYTYDGLGVDRDLVRFYINDERKDFGFNTIQSETAYLIVKDFFNNTMANETIDAFAYSEYNLFIEVYSLIILNQFTYEDIVVNITQVGSNVWMTQVISKQFGLTYRFLTNVEYNMTIYFTNETLYTSRIVNLIENSHIESFGEPTGIPEYPKDVYFSVYTGTGIAIQQQLLKFYIDGDRADFGFNTIESTIITLIVKDFFNTTLFNQTINTTGIYEYDISISIYSLKVKNEGQMVMNYTLNRGSLADTGNILPDEIIEYQLSTNSYVFEYTNQEDDSSGSISFTLDEDKVYILNSTYYDVYISIFDTTRTLNWENVKFYINDTRTDFGFNTLSTDYMNLKVLDYFNSTLFDQDVFLKGLNEYNIFVTLYSLKIQNQAEEVANYTLTLGSVTESKDILPNEIIEYLLASGTYTFEYVNQEDDSYYTDSIFLTDNVVYVINTTYHDVYIGLYNFYGIVNMEEVRFYINNTRADFGFNTMKSDYINLKVLDFFNSTLYDETVYLKDLKEYSIFISAYTLIVNNEYNIQSIKIKITRGGISVERIIESQGFVEFKLYANLKYYLVAYDLNDTVVDHTDVILDEDMKVVEFGFYQADVSVDPTPIINTFANMVWIVIFIVGILLVSVIFYINVSRKYNRVPAEVKNRYKKRKAPNRKTSYSQNILD